MKKDGVDTVIPQYLLAEFPSTGPTPAESLSLSGLTCLQLVVTLLLKPKELKEFFPHILRE